MTGTKRQEQKEITRQRILDAAYQLYAEKGFSVPTSMIAQEAGTSHGAIFVHFPTREALQFSVLDRFSAEIGAKLHQLSIENADIRELLLAHVTTLEAYESFYKNLISEITHLPKETRLLLINMQSIMSHHLGIIIRQGQQAGTIKDLPLHMMFNTWMGLLHYYLQNSNLFTPGTSVLKHYKQELVDSYVTMVTK